MGIFETINPGFAWLGAALFAAYLTERYARKENRLTEAWATRPVTDSTGRVMPSVLTVTRWTRLTFLASALISISIATMLLV